MKKIFYILACAVAVMMVSSCNDNKVNKAIGDVDNDSLAVDDNDSTIYGVCGDGSGMSVMQLITDAGDTLDILVDGEETDCPIVKGGVFSGDRMAVLAYQQNDEWVATNVVNISSLMGKWTSLDKNFEIFEGGVVKSNVKAENNPWTSWKLYNGKLVFNRDTFDIDNLGPDSLLIEDAEGIYAYKRQK